MFLDPSMPFYIVSAAYSDYHDLLNVGPRLTLLKFQNITLFQFHRAFLNINTVLHQPNTLIYLKNTKIFFKILDKKNPTYVSAYR